MEEQVWNINGAVITSDMIDRIRTFQENENAWIKQAKEHAMIIQQWLIEMREFLDGQDSTILDHIQKLNGFVEDIKPFEMHND